jgi:tetratricopeptide (TPR) repeat protein
MSRLAAKRKQHAPPGVAPRRRTLRLWALLAAVLVVSGGVYWFSRVRSANEVAAEPEPMSAEERSLRDEARRHRSDPMAQEALGLYLLDQRRPYEAMWAFQDALDMRPADAPARRGLARALVVAGLHKQALEALATASAPSAGAPPVFKQEDVENRRVAAAAYLAEGDPVGAVGVLSAAAPALNESAAALLDLGNAQEALGNDDAAMAAYQRQVLLEPSGVEGELALARVALQQRRWEVVFQSLARARRAAPEDPRPLYQLGIALLARGGPAAESQGPRGAIGLFQRVLQLHPDDGLAYRQLGLWHLRRGEPRPAAVLLEKAVSLHAGSDETRLTLAAALEAAGEKAEAAYQRGLYDEAVRRPDLAVQEYRRLAALDPGRRDVPLLLSAAYTQLEKTDRALQIARQGMAQHPDEAPYLTRCAMLLMMTDNRIAAADLCRQWIRRRPDAAEPYRLLGRLEREAQHSAEAVRLSEQAMVRDPQNAEYCLETGLALAANPIPANLRRAAAALRHAIALDRSASEPHRRLGEVLERLGDWEGARVQYQRSMDLEHGSRFGVYSLSQLCPRLGKPSRARFYAGIVPVLAARSDAAGTLQHQLHASPDDAAAHARLARLLLDAGDLRQARCQLEQAVALSSGRTTERRDLDFVKRILAIQEQQ